MEEVSACGSGGRGGVSSVRAPGPRQTFSYGAVNAMWFMLPCAVVNLPIHPTPAAGRGGGGALPALAGHETPCQQAQRSLAHRHGRPSFLCTLRELLGVDGRDARRTLGRVREPKVGQEVALANVKEKVLAACTSERSRTPGGAGVRQRRRAMACSPLGAAPYRRAARWSSRAAARARRSRTARWRPCLSTRAQCGSRPATCPRRVHGGVSGA